MKKETSGEKFLRIGGGIVKSLSLAATIGFGILFVVAKTMDYKAIKKGGKNHEN